jgi:hypothetical protein
MPLLSGKSQSVVSKNISELHTGPTYQRTKKRFGKQKADKQAVAIALSKARERVPKRVRASGAISDAALKKSK